MDKMTLSDLKSYYNEWVTGTKSLQDIANAIYQQAGNADPTGVLSELVTADYGEFVRSGLIHMVILLTAYFEGTKEYIAPAQNAVDEIKAFAEPSANICKATLGRYRILTQDGDIVQLASETIWGMSDMVPVDSSTAYTFAAYDFYDLADWSELTTAADRPRFFIAFYDSSRALIDSVISVVPVIDTANHKSSYTVNSPGEAANAAFCIYHAPSDDDHAPDAISTATKLSITEGASAPNQYITPYTSADTKARSELEKIGAIVKAIDSRFYQTANLIGNVITGRYYLTASGQIASSALRWAYGVGDFVKVSPATTYTLGFYDIYGENDSDWEDIIDTPVIDPDTGEASPTNNPVVHIRWYNSEKNVIGNEITSGIKARKTTGRSITSPSNAAYIAFYLITANNSVRKELSDKTKLSLTESGTIPPDYIPPYSLADIVAREAIRELQNREEVDPLTVIDPYISASSSNVPAIGDTLRILSYNVAKYTYDNDVYNLNPLCIGDDRKEDMRRKLINLRSLLMEADADVCCVQENRTYAYYPFGVPIAGTNKYNLRDEVVKGGAFDGNTYAGIPEAERRPTDKYVFKPLYPFCNGADDITTLNQANGPVIFERATEPAPAGKNNQRGVYGIQAENIVVDGATITPDVFWASKAWKTVNGKSVLIYSVHLQNNGGRAENVSVATRRAQLEAVIAQAHSYTESSPGAKDGLFIICGDFNSAYDADKETVQEVTAANNMTIANGGYLGWIETHPNPSPTTIDNIICSQGLIIKRVRTFKDWFDKLYSDHIPLIADIIVL